MSHPYSDDCTCPECTAKFNRVLIRILDSNEEKEKLKAEKKKKRKRKKEKDKE